MTKLKVLIPSRNLLKFRLLIYAVSLIHLVITATKLLSIDFESSKDPALHCYSRLKWRVITTWFNLLTLGYLPICVYCDWRALRGEGERWHVQIFNQFRSFCFSSLILPSTALSTSTVLLLNLYLTTFIIYIPFHFVLALACDSVRVDLEIFQEMQMCLKTMFADILFWQLWHKDRELIVPLSADDFISIWSHHSMHTASLVFVIFDLICVQRKRPTNMLPGIIVLSSFVSIYLFVCFKSLLNEDYVYPLLKSLSAHKLIVLAVYFYISSLFYYTGQWIIVDLVHGRAKLQKTV